MEIDFVPNAIASVKDATKRNILFGVFASFGDFRNIDEEVAEYFDSNFERNLNAVKTFGFDWAFKPEFMLESLRAHTQLGKEYKDTFGNVPFSVALHKALRVK